MDYFQVLGERHTGTKYLNQYLNKNSDFLCISENKHAALTEENIDDFYVSDESKKLGRSLRRAGLVCMHRNIFNWCEAMCRNPYGNFAPHLQLHQFIKSRFKSKLEFPPFSKDPAIPARGFPNVIQLRNYKYEKWLEQKYRLDILFLSYDEMCLEPEKFMARLEKHFNIKLAAPPTSDPRFLSKNIAKNPGQINMIGRENYQFITREMDFQQEIRLGYNYGWWHKYLR